MKTCLFKPFQLLMFIVLMVTLLLPAWSSASGQENAKLKSAIEEINSKFVDVFRSGNADDLASFYTVDAQLMFPGAPTMSGVDEIMAYWQGAINAGVNNVKLETIEVSGCGNEVIEYGNYTVYVGDNFTVDQGKYIVIWKKVGKQLKIFRDISNSDNPPSIAKAVDNDTIMIIHNFIKADKVDDFKKFNTDILIPLFRKDNPALSSTGRMLTPLRANEDGTYTFIYIIYPAVTTPGAYSILPVLIKEYGEDRAREIMKTSFTDALSNPQAVYYYLVREMGN